MKTIVGLFWSVMAGFALACAVIVFSQLLGAGSDSLGFTVWTYRYYTLSLFVSGALLTFSKPARQYWKWMLLFLLAIVLVMAIGFDAYAEPATSNLDVAANVAAMTMFLAKLVMYVVPGGVTAFYAFTAYTNLPPKPSKPVGNDA
ncbi:MULTISPECIES: hypothetical protein [Pseudomonas]|jgi:hypothetical protein|uniref:Transmembrane protein n=4 Tax=Pseudomonas TaxID=286 RepID=Q8VMM0_PSEPU|nr:MULTISPECIES: hypothetical protein [Pseudomonas]KAB0494896.1 hypothetical protein F7R06_29390 [Pseudomonas moorei]MDD2039577.1 hypothetical protein [Pseudomonas putida]MDD2082384.1 hypothetical protein [Pseudomonas putida]QDW60923.1 hypothetical protein FFH79_029335 [Pseudomonas sp. KBS0802]CAC86769.1 hypothetical protein [Pseudomonas putida]